MNPIHPHLAFGLNPPPAGEGLPRWQSPVGFGHSGGGGSTPDAPPERDVLRDSFLRYWGYVNEAAESLKDLLAWGVDTFWPGKKGQGQAIASRWIKNNAGALDSYKIVNAYVIGDAVTKGVQAFNDSRQRGDSTAKQYFHLMDQSVDAGLFQVGASLYIPAFFVSTARDAMKHLMSRLTGNQQAAAALREELQTALKPGTPWVDKALGQMKQLAIRGLEALPLNQWAASAPWQRLMSQAPRFVRFLESAVPLVASFALIPILVKPLDSLCEVALDVTWRPAMRWAEKHFFGGSRKALPSPPASEGLHPHQAFSGFRRS